MLHEQLYDPTVFWQLAFVSQIDTLAAHSSTSMDAEKHFISRKILVTRFPIYDVIIHSNVPAIAKYKTQA